MAQVGRISGPVLQENLLRNGLDIAFRNDSNTTQLLYLDVTTGKVGINRNAPITELNIEGTARSTTWNTTALTSLVGYEISGNNINVRSGNIILNAPTGIKLSNLETEAFQATDNTISTHVSNANIDFQANGTGTVESIANTNISGNIHATGNITTNGDIIFGDQNTDSIVINAEVKSSIIPASNNTYALGSPSKRWDTIYSTLINGSTSVVGSFDVSGVEPATQRQGNMFWVAQNGDDTNVGDHPNGPFKTLKHALAFSDASTAGPVVIHVAPGGYEEELPLVVPPNTTILGADYRNTIIRPTSADQSKDVFHLNGETTISNITIKDFYYDSGNNTGYAFRFAPNAVVSTRSPYIQNVTVITQGTPITVTASSTFSVNSQETRPKGITFNNDGTKMFIVGEIGDDVNEYTLSTGFDLSSIVTFVDSFAVTQCPNPTAVKFNADGTKMFVTGPNNDNVHQYALTTGFDVSSASFTQTLVTTVDSDNFGLDFKPDGTKMYITGNQNNKIYEYNLSSAFDISSATFNQDLTLTAIDTEPFGIEWSTDGTRLFIVGTRGNGVDEFAVGTPYDISTLTHIGFYSIGGNPSGIHISPDGTKMFIIGNQSDTVKSYDLSVSYRIKVPTDDPRGFAQGDAGRGAWIDGASVNSASVEAAMLFHSATFITPGVDAITMTNGVRVEWLNSFTYFANRGLYAVNGSTGYLSSDGSTLKLGAEIRAIGSACVYGNYGAVADGSDCIMYLISHNFAYIGAGKFVDNDPSRSIQANETTESNSGKVYHVSQDHGGDFRIGDQFFVDFDTGTTSLTLSAAQVNEMQSLNITDSSGTSVITPTLIDIGNFRIQGNNINTLFGDINLDAATEIAFKNDVNFKKNLSLTGSVSVGTELIVFGDTFGQDTVEFNADLASNAVPDISGYYSLGRSPYKWRNGYFSEANVADIKFVDTTVTTNISNSDLELQANGVGKIYLPNADLEVTVDAQVSGHTLLTNTNITGNITHTGLYTVSQDFNVTGNLIIQQNLNVVKGTLEKINIRNNVIETQSNDDDLDIRASGSGNIILDSTLVNNSVTVQGSVTTGGLNLNSITADFTTNDIDIFDNIITTTQSNSDLQFRSAGSSTVNFEDIAIDQTNISTDGTLTLAPTESIVVNSTAAVKLPTGTIAQRSSTQGDFRFNSSKNVFEFYINSSIALGGVYSDDLFTNVLAHPTNDTLQITVDNSNIGSFDSDGINIHQLQVEDINIDNNTIRTNVSNSDLELSPDGSGDVVIDDITFDGNSIKNTANNAVTLLTNTGIGYWQFAGSGVVRMPFGDASTRPSTPEIGFTRVNTTSDELESYNGTAWKTSAGEFDSISVENMEDEALVQSLIYG